MTHLWLRAEQKPMERRVGLDPIGARKLLDAGFQVTVEDCPQRAIPIDGYAVAGCAVAPAHSWVDAPTDAIIYGLKELDTDGPDLTHRHIMFGHAYKGQAEGPQLLGRFTRAGGTLLDLEFVTDDTGRRVAAFGYWAGFAGAAVGIMAWIAQQSGGAPLGAVTDYVNKDALVRELRSGLEPYATTLPNAIIIGALGRVGTGASDLLRELDVDVTKWDMAETAHGGPFPQILEHNLFVNCILASPNVPVFVPTDSGQQARALRVIADISCDPNSPYNPVPVYDRATDFDAPVVRVYDDPVLDVMAIDHLPSMLPVESSIDFSNQIVPHLLQLDDLDGSYWSSTVQAFRQAT